MKNKARLILILSLTVIMGISVSADNNVKYSIAEINNLTSSLVDKQYLLNGSNSLVFDTIEKKAGIYWECITLKSGMFNPEQLYRINFEYNILEQKGISFFYYLLRSQNGKGKDLYFNNFGNDNSKNKKGRISQLVKIDAVNDYRLIIGIYGKGKIILDNIKIVSVKEDSLFAVNPLKNNVPTTQCSFKQKITGCPEFKIELPRRKTGLSVNACDFGFSSSTTDNTEAFNRAVAHCKRINADKLIINKGTYNFKNPQEVMISHLHDTVIEGNGSEFILNDATPGEFIHFVDCNRVSMENLFLDWNWKLTPIASKVEVINVSPNGKYVDLLFADIKKLPEKKLDMELFDNLSPNKFRLYLPKLKTKYIRDNVVRIFPSSSQVVQREFRLGRKFRIRHFYMNRKAIKVDDCKHLTLKNICIYSMPGPGFVFKKRTSHVQLLGCRIDYRPGRKKIITTAGDHFHQLYTEGWFKLENCVFRGGGDDMMNIKGIISCGVKKRSAKKLEVYNTKNWAMQFDPGNSVELRDIRYRLLYTGTVKSASWNKKNKAFVVTFNEALPRNISYYSIVINKNFNSANFIIRNCVFENGEAQGILIQAPNGLIENCSFANLKGPALQLSTGVSEKWSEGDLVRNVIIRNNKFSNCNYENRMKFGQSATVYLGMYSFLGKTKTPVIQDILFEDNIFNNTTGLMFYITSSQNILIRHNTFNHSIKASYNLWPNAVMLNHATDVLFFQNIWNDGKVKIFTEANNHNKVDCYGNRQNFHK